MTHDIIYRLHKFFIAAVCMTAALGAQGADDTSPYFESAEVRDEIIKNYQGRRIWTNNWDDLQAGVDTVCYQNDPKYGNLRFQRLKNRRALTGKHCTVNKLISAVGVGSWNKSMGNLTDDDLDNYAEFNKVVGADVTVSPIVSVRDMDNYYTKGTEAGFCVVAGSGNAVLTLDVIKAWTIGFYRDGELVGSVEVREGAVNGGINLSLIQIPGSEDAVMMLTAIAPGLFDEILLDASGGIKANVGELLKIKYAFVGEAIDYTITESGIDKYNTNIGEAEGGPGKIVKSELKGWNPVLLGIPFPLLSSEVDKMYDEDLDNYAALTPIISVGYQGGAKFMVRNETNPNEEGFQAGYEVGFKYKMGSALALDAGAWIMLRLYDRNGKVVQEENISSQVLGLSVAKGGDGSSSVTAKVPFSGAEIRFHTVLGVNLGAMGVHYAFVKAKPEVSHYCPINPSMSTSICDTQTAIQLHSNPDISVTWSLVEEKSKRDDPTQPWPSVTPDGYVTNLSKGTYVFRAKAKDGCEDFVTLNPKNLAKDASELNKLLINNNPNYAEYAYSDKIYDSSGSLLSISQLSNPENIVSSDVDACAHYAGGLSIADNICITGVKALNGQLLYDGYPAKLPVTTKDGERDETDEEYIVRTRPRRMGFVVTTTTTVIGVNLLEFLQIRCYHNGDEVYRSIISESNAVSANIAGSNSTDKIRYSIEVPQFGDDGYLQIDEIQLWTSGVLKLDASDLNIYYAFIEDADPMGLNPTVLNWKDTNTVINSDATTYGQAIAVASTTNNLGYLVDPDEHLLTPLLIDNTVSVGGGITIAVKLGRTFDYRHELGIITDNKTFALGAKVGNWMVVRPYYRGEPTGEEFKNWGVVGANVAGYGERNYLMFHPQLMYDELRIELAQIVGALDFQNYYGIFVRADVDNDGIPDYMDPESCGIKEPEVDLTDVCVGQTIKVTAKMALQDWMTVRVSEPGIGEHRAQSDEHGNWVWDSYVTKKPGKYQMVFYDGSNRPIKTVQYMVHPNVTRWREDATNTDWNKWDNWTDGSPYCCTNVIIPSQSTNFPVLGVPTKGDEFCCNGIHFEPKGAVENLPSLNYHSAWVDLLLVPNQYLSVAMPLQDTYTGDIFRPVDASRYEGKYFVDLIPNTVKEDKDGNETELDDGMAVENRFNPSVYQRLWANSTTGKKLVPGGAADTPIAINTNDGRWSHYFNHLAYKYPIGQPVSIWLDNGSLPKSDSILIRLPKLHTVYNYYDDVTFSKIPNASETLTRTAPGRFIYEEGQIANLSNTVVVEEKTQDRNVYADMAEFRVTLHADEATEYFHFGNPFMSHLDLNAFLAANPDIQAVSYTYDGKSAFVASTGRELLTSGEQMTLEPMQGVFLKVATAATELSVTLNRAMIKGEEISAAEREELPFTEEETVSIVATAEGLSSTAIATKGDFRMESLFDGEVEEGLKIFAIADGAACDIATHTLESEIPLGVYVSKPQTVNFRVDGTGGFDKNAWELYDALTGTAYPLDIDIEVDVDASSAGRFRLRQAGVDTPAAPAPLLTITGRTATVTYPGALTLAAYALDGRRIGTAAGEDAVSLALPAGICVLRAGGYSWKVVVR